MNLNQLVAAGIMEFLDGLNHWAGFTIETKCRQESPCRKPITTTWLSLALDAL
jgi:hypothetical protein